MSDPLAILSLAIAAGGGQIGGQPAGRFIAAGHALLQRSAPLVRALAGRRSAIVLPPGGAFLTALAATDGHGAVLLAPTAAAAGPFARHFEQAQVGVIFTSRRLADQLPAAPIAVWLDEVPLRAVVLVDGVERAVDLGSHFGLALAGDTAAEGSPEECLNVDGRWLSHADVLSAARERASRDHYGATTEATVGVAWSRELLTQFTAVLLHGGRISTSPPAP